MNKSTLPKRFADKIDFSGECWIWTAGKCVGGYGVYRYKRKNIKAHRFSWEHFNGTICNGLKVLHKCDTPSCVNPDHHFLGTQKDNIDDMYAKGRNNNAFGETQGSARLTQKNVDEIRETYKPGKAPFKSEFSQKSLAKKFGIGKTQIRRILNFESWTPKEKELTVVE